jgi:hypothetical protein
MGRILVETLRTPLLTVRVEGSVDDDDPPPTRRRKAFAGLAQPL